MRIESLKLWQWMLVGLVVGSLFSLVLWFQGPWFDNAPLETMPTGELDWYVLYDHRPPIEFWQRKNGAHPENDPLRREQNLVPDGQPLLKEVVVHPAPSTDKTGSWWVTGKYATFSVAAPDPKKPDDKKLIATWTPFKTPAGFPYEPMYHSSHHDRVQKEADDIKKEMAEDAAKGLPLNTQKRDGLRDRQEELDSDAKLQKSLGGPDSFADVGKFLAFAQTLEPKRKFSFGVAWYDAKLGVWTMPPLAGLLIVGFGGALLIQILQVFGLAAWPEVEKKVVKPVATPKAAPATRAVMPVAGVKVVTPAPQRPMTEAEKKEYGGEYYPVVKSGTAKDKH